MEGFYIVGFVMIGAIAARVVVFFINLHVRLKELESERDYFDYWLRSLDERKADKPDYSVHDWNDE